MKFDRQNQMTTQDAIDAVRRGEALPEGFSVELSADAKAMAMSMQEEDNTILRLYIEGKGCDGFYYGVSFDQSTDKDLMFGDKDVPIAVDEETFEFVHGSRIEWVDDERGKGFLVSNPNHDAFRGKFFKRPAWRERKESPQTT